LLYSIRGDGYVSERTIYGGTDDRAGPGQKEEIEMIEQSMRASRRRMLRIAVGGVSTALLVSSRAQVSDKMTKARAEYQDTPNGIYSCATCTLFEAPNSCKVVEGEVSKDGWCKAFALAD
jgi:hypothetical protein